jgi:hypothetical protein
MTASRKQLAVALALGCAVAGCQSHGAGQSAPGSAPAGGAGGTTHPAKPIDACSMVSPQDVAKILGVTVAGRSTGKNPQMGDCSWENPATYESISLQISNPGTAINNTLPPPPAGMPDASKPGPDGMRLMGGGMVEFVAGKRVNTIQVAVLKLSADQANSAAIDLARKIIPQVPE